MVQKTINQAGGNARARQLNMELMRVVAMMLVLLVHACFLSYWPMKADFIAAPVKSAVETYLEAIALVCVNCFILISGYFSIRPKWKSLLNLLFLIYFYKFIFWGLDLAFNGFSTVNLVKTLYPFTDWFVGAYLGLYLISPVLNKFIEDATEKQLRISLIAYLGVQVTFGWLLPVVNIEFLNFSFMDFNCGYSVLSFVGLYVLARYIRLHALTKFSGFFERLRKRELMIAFFSIALVNSLIYTLARLYAPDRVSYYLCQLFVRYTNPLTVASAVFLLLFFIRLKVEDTSHMASTIVVFGKSAFAVYLIHFNFLILPYYKAAAKWMYTELPVWGWVPAVIVFVMAVYTACVLIDQARLALWRAISK